MTQKAARYPSDAAWSEQPPEISDDLAASAVGANSSLNHRLVW